MSERERVMLSIDVVKCLSCFKLFSLRISAGHHVVSQIEVGGEEYQWL